MPYQGKRYRPYRIVSAGLGVCLAVVSIAHAEHRISDEDELDHSATTFTHAPNWYQYDIDNYHPIGCGPTAWAIVYAYWYEYKGKNNLFSGTPRAEAAGDELAEQTETRHGQFGSAVFGRTMPGNLCQGIEYAKARGYEHSTCRRVTGTELDKFAHVKRYINADRPVILLINNDGRGVVNHYVVVEGVRKRQEWSMGDWRDRDVEYLVNFGKQGRASEWISVRQRGRNTGDVYTSGSAFLINISGTPLPEASSANEEACKDWCLANKPECATCSHLRGCMPGYKRIMSFTEAGKNWYACQKKDSGRANASEKNRLDCENWCEKHREDKGCVKCDTKITCGRDHVRLESFTGYGNNYHACRREGQSSRDRASDRNHEDCLSWCEKNKPQCVECSKLRYCGSGLEPLKRFTGYGTNWHACGKNKWGINSEKNHAACKDWCKSHRPTCIECRATKGCGKDQTSMAEFKGPGKDWYACRKADSKANRDACNEWCNAHKPTCVECRSDVGCGRNQTKMESFKGPGDNWFACRAASSASNKDACETYCNQNKPQCLFCSEKNRCGRGHTRMKLFKGKGENWAACRKSSRAENSEANHAECTEWCRANSECASCKEESGCGVRMKRIRTFKDHWPGKNWYACKNK